MEDFAKGIGLFSSLHQENMQKLDKAFASVLGTVEKLFNDSLKTERVIGETIEKTPQQIQKRSKRLTSADESDNFADNNFPIAGGRIKGSKTYVNKKQANGKNQLKRFSKIKQEKYSFGLIVDEPENELDVTKTKETKQSTVHSMEIDEIETEKQSLAKAAEKSIEVILVDPKLNVVEIESENEIMPPPTVPAPKTRKLRPDLRNNNKENSNNAPQESFNDVAIKIEQDIDTTKISSSISDSSSNSKKKKSKKHIIPKPILLKEERRSTLGNKNLSAQKNGSLESVYEDAMPLPSMLKNTNNHHSLDKGNALDVGDKHLDDGNVIISNKFQATNHNVAAHDIATALADATFLTTPISDATFTTNNPNVNATTVTDVTYDVGVTNNFKTSQDKTNTNIHSIMTEDDSEEDDLTFIKSKNPDIRLNLKAPLIKYKPMPKSKLKELFNPCVQSPVKKKVEAFEKAANQNDYSTQPPQRQTRTKTRAIESKENTDQNTLPKPSITPHIGFQPKRLLTPQQESNYTPTLGGLTTKKLPSSTSKVIGLQKALSTNKIVLTSSSSNSNKTPSQSRDNSIDRAIAKSLVLTDEKKKAREEKRQKAALIRGLKEKERHERLKKLMEEREEKSRKKLMEKEKLQLKSDREKNLRIMEDINKNFKKLEEQNEERELQRKVEKQKQYLRVQAESAKRERQMLENLKIQKAKDQIQIQLEQNQKSLFKHKLLLKQKLKDNGYNFDMIETDDSTDEESTVKSKRPPVPEWSKEQKRIQSIAAQGYLHTDLIDSFFSVQPMTPNLLEIFPAIDPRDLKRNSSAIWNTPPRYSQITKY